MALIGSKKSFSKKDINFFEQFTASARKQTQVLAAVVFVGIVAIGLCLAILVVDIIRNAKVNSEINELNQTLQSPEYEGLELKAQSLQQEINDKNQYYYTLTQMKRILDETKTVSSEIIDIIPESIPSDAYVDQYSLDGAMLTLSGVTFSYYDAANICNILNEAGVFSGDVAPSVERSTINVDGVEEISEFPVDIVYSFAITGNLTPDSVVSISRFLNTDTGVVALSGITSQTVTYGSDFSFAGINTYVANGQTYNLASVNVNGEPVSAEEFEYITAEDSINGVASGNVSVSLYYVDGDAVVAEEGGAE